MYQVAADKFQAWDSHGYEFRMDISYVSRRFIVYEFEPCHLNEYQAEALKRWLERRLKDLTPTP